MLEIGRLARETVAVGRIVGIGPPPEVRRVGHMREGCLEDREALLRGADDERRAARRRGVLQSITRPALGRVHADGQRISPHLRADDAHAHDDRLAARLAGKFEVGRLGKRHRADGLSHDGRRGLDRVRVRLAAHPHGPDQRRIDLRPRQGIHAQPRSTC